ncbi:NAD(P)H-hydrate epimerase [Defluviimonas sp. WL0024]|uniref:NAD(P)H-hydrate epimerase n=1 Tax=Albidovulum salinarum TaxID=2984153 RepID=A0ABT2X470_9RHOB|nr:NAD(P)H-hydrate epimerase [Defluviimonas sp. WL0024]MCU9848744.1 NAD(P)H-hydrate epimerase [Defluviimonas sp. WL0024]
MTELLTAAQMRAIEQAAIASGEVTGLELMERAGRGVVEAIFEEWPELKAGSHRAVVLCGPGNNGGDGFVVARLLKEWGWEVEVFLYGEPAKLPPDARVNYERWRGMGEVTSLSFPRVTEADVERFNEAAYGLSGTSLVVDAIFGVGLTRSIEGLSPLFGYNDIEVGVGDRLTPARHVAIDIPSGMFADEPEPPDYLSWFLADLTVTFHRMKPAHLHSYTTASCGNVVVKDIGLGPWDHIAEVVK